MQKTLELAKKDATAENRHDVVETAETFSRRAGLRDLATSALMSSEDCRVSMRLKSTTKFALLNPELGSGREHWVIRTQWHRRLSAFAPKAAPAQLRSQGAFALETNAKSTVGPDRW
jgi:hypothetical protein